MLAIFVGVLTALLVAAKLTGLASLSWLLALSPALLLLAGAALWVVLFVGFGLVVSIVKEPRK